MRDSNPAIRVLVADDHPLMLEGLSTVIQSQSDMEVVALATGGKEAIEAYYHHKPDITLLDLKMPDLDGIEVINKIRQDFPDARIIILTTYSGDEFIYRAFKAGARGYVLKTTLSQDLIKTIRDVHSGLRCVPPEIAARLAGRLPSSELTAREVEILKLVAKGKKNKEIASELAITESAIKYHINVILAKLGANDRTEAVTLSVKRGIIVLD